MPNELRIAIGQHSEPGRKPLNQDFHAAHIPNEPLLSSKGVTIALADGISSSDVSQIASRAAVNSFIQDYYSTSEAWSVKTSAQRVLTATNSWLFAQTRGSVEHHVRDRGYVCTFSGLVIKSNTAHLFYAGDTRIYQLHGNNLEQLTEDHRYWVSQDKSYLSRALGIQQQLDLDYRSVSVEQGDVFILCTDGVYEFVSADFMINTVREHLDDLDTAARLIVQQAYERGSHDNLTVQLVHVEQLPQSNADEIYQQLTELPFPPQLEARMEFDGFTILRELQVTHRSHVFVARDNDTQAQVVIKTPSIDQREDPAYLERFLMEEWVARRLNNAHILKPCTQTRKRNYLYTVSEYIDGQSLNQWMIDHPQPSLQNVRDIIEQIARGLRAFHRLEMLHQDLRPNNIMIDQDGTVKIIDFGSTRVAGLMEIASPLERYDLLGTAQYTAPEYFLGQPGSNRSDLFSLGVIAYQMISGKLPYGAQVARARTPAAQRKLSYRSLLEEHPELPAWVDDAIRKAVHPNPLKRYEDSSEFIYDLSHPNKAFVNRTRPPLMERNPLMFWKGLSFVLAILLIVMAIDKWT